MIFNVYNPFNTTGILKLFFARFDFCRSMRIATIAFLVFFGMISAIHAQYHETYLVDVDTRQPIQFATLECKVRNAAVTFFTSDNQGRLESCACGVHDTVAWKIRHLTYVFVDTLIPCSQRPDTIWMQLRDYEFNGVTVTGKDEGVRIIGDTIRFDLSVFKKPHQKDLKDLLNELPGIEVTKKGHVSFKGKPVGQILLNGKSLAHNRFNMINRVIKKDDLASVQIVPEDPYEDPDNSRVNLDLVLKPKLELLGQMQSRVSNQGELEGSASLIQAGDALWNHAGEASFSQIGDSHRPQLNFFHEFYDGANKYRRAVRIRGRRPTPTVLFKSEHPEKEQVSNIFYNALFENSRSELNLYARYSNYLSVKPFKQTHFNVNTGELLWKESNNEDVELNSSVFSMLYKYNFQKKFTLVVSSHVAYDKNNLLQKGMIEIYPSASRANEWQLSKPYSNASIFAHTIWHVDSVWTLQTGMQVGIENDLRKYDFGMDSVFYDLVLGTNGQVKDMGYHLSRKTKNVDFGSSLERRWKPFNQRTNWIVNFKTLSMSDTANPEGFVAPQSAFRQSQVYKRRTLTGQLVHKINILKLYFSAAVGGELFQSDYQGQPQSLRYAWTGIGRFRFEIKRNQSVFFNYSSEAGWLADDNLWRTAQPKSRLSYAIAAIASPVIIRAHSWEAGWREFSVSTASFSLARLYFRQEPEHYGWRQKSRAGIIVDTLLLVQNFRKAGFDLSTGRKIRGIPFTASLKGALFGSSGDAQFPNQELTSTDISFSMNAKDILQSKIIFIQLGSRIKRLTLAYGDLANLPPRWDSQSSVKVRLFVKRLNTWIGSEMAYLWRGDIYTETLVSGLIEKKVGVHLLLALGVENLLNLNVNTRSKRFLMPQDYREIEQSVFGGRIYFKAKYQF